MPRERAKTFADRLPPVVPKVEDDISHLSDEMADILYPGRRPRPFRVGVQFEPFEGPDFERALALARRAAVYTEATEDETKVHRAAFETRQAGILRDLYQIVSGRPGTEVTVDGKKMPYAAELWLPLMWMFVTQETR
ncbi:MAG TPA: hypothetical protein VFM29_02980 [Vicinamibacteria bacterium]|nr:hypothetical protein [Vicinamibacteria bacterium]